MKGFLAQYEKTFEPSDFDADVNSIKVQEKILEAEVEAANVVTTAIPETIPGFRVQILFTQEIDQANQMRDSVTKILIDEWAYIIYDSPYYKVRVGNFIDRSAANQMVKKLAAAGYTDAWVVPDNILKNPPAKPPDIFIEPEKPLKAK